MSDDLIYAYQEWMCSDCSGCCVETGSDVLACESCGYTFSVRGSTGFADLIPEGDDDD